MSDHSHDHEEPQNPIAKVIGIIFVFAVPAAFIVMLAIVGFAFIGGVRATPVAVTPPASPNGVEPGTPDTGTTPDVAQVSSAELGKKSYQTCLACHGPDAKGVKAGPMSMAPSLIGSEMLLHENPDVPTLIVLKGIQKEGMDYMGMMMGLGVALDDEKIAAVLTYTRTNFGNSGTPITTEQVAAARAKFAEVNTPAGVKRADILKIAGAE